MRLLRVEPIRRPVTSPSPFRSLFLPVAAWMPAEMEPLLVLALVTLAALAAAVSVRLVTHPSNIFPEAAAPFQTRDGPRQKAPSDQGRASSSR
jgi:hypothetical protein